MLRIHISAVENIELSCHKGNEGSLGTLPNIICLILSAVILCRISFQYTPKIHIAGDLSVTALGVHNFVQRWKT